MATAGEPGVFTSNLNDVPYPPGDSSGNYRTGEGTKDTSRREELYYPLSVTDFSSAATNNNLGAARPRTRRDGSRAGLGPR